MAVSQMELVYDFSTSASTDNTIELALSTSDL